MLRKAAHKTIVYSILLLVLLAGILSCSQDAESPYDQSYIEFKLDPSSALGFNDLQSIKIFVDPYAAFNLLSIFDNGRSNLGAYDYNSESKIYMGFEYSPLYICRLEDLNISVTKKGSQSFIDSADYTLQFMGEMPEEADDRPYIQITVNDSSQGVVLTAVQGAAGSPLLEVNP